MKQLKKYLWICVLTLCTLFCLSGCKDTKQPEEKNPDVNPKPEEVVTPEAKELGQKLSGRWVSEDGELIVFGMDTEWITFYHGLTNAGGGRNPGCVESYAMDDSEFIMAVHYNAQAATEAEEAYDALDIEVRVDTKLLSSDKLVVKLAEEEYKEYTREAITDDPSTPQEPDKPAVTLNELLEPISGDWLSKDGALVLLQKTEGNWTFYAGLANAGGGRNPGRIEGYDFVDNLLTLTVHYAEQAATEMTDAYAEATESVVFDLSKVSEEKLDIRLPMDTFKEFARRMDTTEEPDTPTEEVTSTEDVLHRTLSYAEFSELMIGSWYDADNNYVVFYQEGGWLKLNNGNTEDDSLERSGGQVKGYTRNQTVYTLEVYFPAVAATEYSAGQMERTVEVTIDIKNIANEQVTLGYTADHLSAYQRNNQ